MKATLLILSLFWYTVSSSLLSKQKRNCVLDPDGQMNCVDETRLRVSSPVRMRRKAPCERKDIMCWCEMARKYTNAVRKKNGISKMLKLGTHNQMDNAMRYAKKLAGMGYLKHQDLTKVTREIGCKRWMGGENLAFNYETGDIAKMCVDQWIGSRGHFENLIRDWFEEVVVGFYFMPDGRVYCVQTFALPYPRGTFGKPTDKGCERVSSSPSSPPTTSAPPSITAPTTTPPATTAPATTGPATMTAASTPLSCRCIKYGKNCTEILARKAMNGCIARWHRSYQPYSCKMNCCNFCENYPDLLECRNRYVKRICRAL